MPDTLMLKTGSTLLLVNDKLALNPSCCCCVGSDAILVWNSNAITDDDFDIKLNGTLLANRDGHSAPLCKATIFSKDELIDERWSDFPAGCSPITVETFGLDTSLFVEGSNMLTFVQTADNGAGNFGTLQVVRLTQQGDGTYKTCRKWLDTFYNGAGNYLFTWHA